MHHQSSSFITSTSIHPRSTRLHAHTHTHTDTLALHLLHSRSSTFTPSRSSLFPPPTAKPHTLIQPTTPTPTPTRINPHCVSKRKKLVVTFSKLAIQRALSRVAAPDSSPSSSSSSSGAAAAPLPGSAAAVSASAMAAAAAGNLPSTTTVASGALFTKEFIDDLTRLAYVATKRFVPQVTPFFMDTEEAYRVEAALSKKVFKAVGMVVYGGYDKADRVLMMFYNREFPPSMHEPNTIVDVLLKPYLAAVKIEIIDNAQDNQVSDNVDDKSDPDSDFSSSSSSLGALGDLSIRQKMVGSDDDAVRARKLMALRKKQQLRLLADPNAASAPLSKQEYIESICAASPHIHRRLLGDIFVHKTRGAHLFCLPHIVDDLVHNLQYVRNFPVKVSPIPLHKVNVKRLRVKHIEAVEVSPRIDLVCISAYELSRKEVKHIFEDGHVLINGDKCTLQSRKIKPTDIISIKGRKGKVFVEHINVTDNGDYKIFMKRYK